MKLETGHIKYKQRGKNYTAQFTLNETEEFPGLTIISKQKKLSNGIHTQVTLKTKTSIDISEIKLIGNTRYDKEDTILCNGYQSWTDSREFKANEKIKKLFPLAKKYKINYFGEYNFYPYTGSKGILHSHTFCYIRGPKDTYRFSGSLSESSGYTIYEVDTKKNVFNISKECQGLTVEDECKIFDIINIFGNDEDIIFTEYFKTMKVDNRNVPYCTGWTSWYNYYTDISEKIIMENLKAYEDHKIPIDTFQIDDGYQEAVGDWLKVKPTFPKGMEYISKEIRKRKLKAGLWLAPFVCEKESDIYRKHRAWLLHDPRGNLVYAAWNPNWSGNFYCLDIYNKEVQDYLKEVFDTILKKWKFDMVKLDFLYGAAQIPRNGKTRGAIMTDAMELLRSLVGKKEILGCGVPLGPSFGKVEYCRIGSDVALKWEDKLLEKVHYRERVSTINSLRSTVGRRRLNGKAFLNDPDVFILRDENNKLSKNQQYTLYLLNNIFGGLIFTSDNISSYSEETMNLYKASFPFREKTDLYTKNKGDFYSITFKIDKNHYYAFSNCTNRKCGVILDKGIYFTFDREKNKTAFLKGYSELKLLPYQTICLLKLQDKPGTLAGTTGHIFPGSEIDSFTLRGKKLTIKKGDGPIRNSHVFIRVPEKDVYTINDNESKAVEVAEDCFIVAAEI